MGPMIPDKSLPLNGLHYFVDEDAKLQAYEYTVNEQPYVQEYNEFFQEFCDFIKKRGLERKLGLKMGKNFDGQGWTEFEVPQKHGNILIPQDVSIQTFHADPREKPVTTEWNRNKTHWNPFTAPTAKA
ncbi:hypothetical protein AnigIFM63309_010635 [Aspergillus niger]|nr:hypothetical protein AnigIFM63309_010635 [Aspergillus niger]